MEIRKREQRTHVDKVWGWESWIVNNPLYCGKEMFLKKGYQCSFHRHFIKNETFVVLYGRMLLRFGPDDDINNTKEVILGAGDSFDIPVGIRHQFVGLEETKFYEISTNHRDEDTARITEGGPVCNS